MAAFNPALDRLSAAYRARDGEARRWKAAGGQVVGYLDDMPPPALIAAAGFLPHRVSGDPDSGHRPVMAYGPEDIRPERLEFVNSIFHRLTTGFYDFLDHLIVPASRKSILLLHQRLLAFGREYPMARLPTLHVLDRTIARTFGSSRYNRAQVVKLKAVLETWSGRPLTDAALEEALMAQLRQAELLRDLSALRVDRRVGGVEALEIMGASRFMPAEAFNQALAAGLAAIAQRAPAQGARVFVAGSPLDNASLYDVIEGCGAVVVGESHDWGLSRRSAGDLSPGLSAPIERIAQAFHQTPTSVVFPLDAAVEACVADALACGAQAVVFNVFAHDDAQLWEVPACIEALAARGVASLYLQEQPYRLADAGAVQDRLRPFLASLSVAA